jgi:hypothetical protein
MVVGHTVVSASVSAVLTSALQEVVTEASEGPHGEPKWSRIVRKGLVKGCDLAMRATNFCLETVEQIWKNHGMQWSNCSCTVPPAALTDPEDLPLWLQLVQDPSRTTGDGQVQ